VKVTPAAAVLAVLLAAGCGGSSKAQQSEVPRGSLFVAIKVLKSGKQVLAVVPVKINGHGPYSFALDTGASTSLIDSQVAKELRVPRTGTRQRVAGIASVSKLASIKVKEWSVGGVELPATTIVESNLPFGNARGGVQGLLGSDMLSEFDIVTIDYGNSRLVLHHGAVDVSK
jgi:predicted aspartyl protease